MFGKAPVKPTPDDMTPEMVGSSLAFKKSRRAQAAQGGDHGGARPRRRLQRLALPRRWSIPPGQQPASSRLLGGSATDRRAGGVARGRLHFADLNSLSSTGITHGRGAQSGDRRLDGLLIYVVVGGRLLLVGVPYHLVSEIAEAASEARQKRSSSRIIRSIGGSRPVPVRDLRGGSPSLRLHALQGDLAGRHPVAGADL